MESYASRKAAEHLPAWVVFNKNVASNGDVGIWHETYLCRPGRYECVCNKMPRFTLGKADEHVSVSDRTDTVKPRIKNTI